MPLHNSWVERIFTRMGLRYGDAWVRKWEGFDIALVKADWAHELDGVSADSIVYALGYLPSDWPPTVSAFKEICNRAPEPERPRLNEPKPDPEVAAQVMASMPRFQGPKDPKAWARALKEREEQHRGVLVSGKKMTITQKAMWRAALGVESR